MSSDFIQQAENYLQRTFGASPPESHPEKTLSPAQHDAYVRQALGQNYQHGSTADRMLHPLELTQGTDSNGRPTGKFEPPHPPRDPKIVAAVKRVQGILDQTDKQGWARLLKELERDQRTMSPQEFETLYKVTAMAKDAHGCTVMASPPPGDGPRRK